MAGIIYSKMVGKNDPVYGKIETPVKMLIENESNACEKRKSITKALYNVEKSHRFAETFLGQSDFDIFQTVKEGQGGENDNIETTYKKVIEHVTFMKEFSITKEMVEDAKFGIAVEGKDKAKNFVRAYYKTQNQLCERALVYATKPSFVYAKATFDLTAPDGKPLFSNDHTYFAEKMKKAPAQSNRFCIKDFTSSTNAFETALGELSVRMRDYNDDNGDPMGYLADTIIIPGNMYKVESVAKKAVGSERTTGSDYNDINLQYGNWDIVVLPEWRPANPAFMLMSREANHQLHGNNLFNRTKLEVSSWVDNHTKNLIWNGRARFGVGFAAWKHIMLCEQGESLTGCTPVTLQ